MEHQLPRAFSQTDSVPTEEEMKEACDTGTTRIVFRPMCEYCDKELYSIIDYEENHFENGITYVDHRITPMVCPYCKRIFDGIVIPTKLPVDNRKQRTIWNVKEQKWVSEYD